MQHQRNTYSSFLFNGAPGPGLVPHFCFYCRTDLSREGLGRDNEVVRSTLALSAHAACGSARPGMGDL